VGDVQVLCFDEFHVHDIGDAMLLTRLFNALFARGVFLLVTSNYAPEGLLPNPLYHERFLPVIRLINSRCRCSKWVATPIFAACRPTASISVLPRGIMSGRECGAAPGAERLPPEQPVMLEVNKRPLRALAIDGRRVVLGFNGCARRPPR
jgi:cell division protein ZapE